MGGAYDFDSDALKRMLLEIRGFRLSIETIQGKFKLSQNRSKSDRDSVVTGLLEEGDTASRDLAVFMADYLEEVDERT